MVPRAQLIRRGARSLVLLLCACCACRGFGQTADAGAADVLPLGDAPQADPDRGARPDLPAADGPRHDGSAIPGLACRAFALECLDAADPALIEVPTEGALEQAFAAARAGDTVQIKGLKLGAGWWVPPHVTLRGCAGASLEGNIAFKGDGGAIEGFLVRGEIIAHRSGAFAIRRNRFVAAGSAEAAVSARSTEGLVGAAVTAVVEANWFQGRARGVEAATGYNTLTHSVTLTVRNNIFTGVEKPIVISEDGLVGKVSARIEHNTIHDFDTALTLTSLSEIPVISGTLLAEGKTGVFANSAYEVRHCATWNVATPHSQPPFGGAFASGDPLFVDAAAGDLRLAPGSALVDRIPADPAMPAEDFAGCPRPVGLAGGAAFGDIGALETQP